MQLIRIVTASIVSTGVLLVAAGLIMILPEYLNKPLLIGATLLLIGTGIAISSSVFDFLGADLRRTKLYRKYELHKIKKEYGVYIGMRLVPRNGTDIYEITSISTDFSNVTLQALNTRTTEHLTVVNRKYKPATALQETLSGEV